MSLKKYVMSSLADKIETSKVEVPKVEVPETEVEGEIKVEVKKGRKLNK